MVVAIRAARPDEAAALSELALRSKGHWGYDDAFLAACRAELTFEPARCDGSRLMVAVDGERLLGFSLLSGTPPVGELAALFVDPAAIGQGVGTMLLRHALRRAAELGLERLRIDSDPFAEPFYLRHGAERVGEVPSGSVPGRVLPQLQLVVP